MVEHAQEREGVEGRTRIVTAVWQGVVDSIEGNTAVARLMDPEGIKPEELVAFDVKNFPKRELRRVGVEKVVENLLFWRRSVRVETPGGRIRYIAEYEVYIAKPLTEEDHQRGQRIAEYFRGRDKPRPQK